MEKVKFILEQATKAQNGIRDISLHLSVGPLLSFEDFSSILVSPG